MHLFATSWSKYQKDLLTFRLVIGGLFGDDDKTACLTSHGGVKLWKIYDVTDMEEADTRMIAHMAHVQGKFDYYYFSTIPQCFLNGWPGSQTLNKH